jgi:hypothetical protein
MRRPVILRRCLACPAEFVIKDLSSRASYCPRCRELAKGFIYTGTHQRKSEYYAQAQKTEG